MESKTLRTILKTAVLAVTVLLLTAGASYAQVLTRAGFDLKRHAISMLTLGDQGWIQSANFEITGLLVLACAVGMRRVLRSGPGADKALEGRKVMALMPKGAYAQQAVAQAGMVVALDEHADDIAMASLPCQGVTAFLALQACTTLRNKLRAGSAGTMRRPRALRVMARQSPSSS